MHHLEYAIFILAEVLEKKEQNKQLSSIAYSLASESHNYIPEEHVADERLICVEELESMLDK